MYDLVHPDDVEKVREQLSTTESQNTGRILDLKSKFIQNSSEFVKCWSQNFVQQNNPECRGIVDVKSYLGIQGVFRSERWITLELLKGEYLIWEKQLTQT